MAIPCGAKCAKGVLVTFNLVFWLSGCAILALGIFFLVEEDRATLFKLFKIPGESHALIQFLAYGCIGVGGLIFLIGFLGCCGAIQENKCMLISYFIFLFVILVSELAVGILAMLFQDKMLSHVEKNFVESINKTYGVDAELTRAVDLAQAKLECCGVKSWEDYEHSEWRAKYSKGDHVPKTCCVLFNKGEPRYYMEPRPMNNTLCQKVRPDTDSYHSLENYRHHSSCLIKLEEFLKNQSFFLIAIGCGLAGLEIFGMIFAVCLFKAF